MSPEDDHTVNNVLEKETLFHFCECYRQQSSALSKTLFQFLVKPTATEKVGDLFAHLQRPES